MFETVAPELAGRRSRKLFYESLPFSIGAHGVVIAALLTGQIWSIDFPSHSPKLFTAYSLIATPTPPPPPPPPPAARPAAEIPRVTLPPQLQNLAPTIIPDAIPVVTNDPLPVEAAPVQGGMEGGVEGGVEGGIIGGVIGSVIPVAPPAPEPPPQRETVVVERDEPLPMRAISQDYPAYPEHARTRGWEDSLIVRYVIGKDGRVKEVSTIRPPALRIFEEAAHQRIRQWRFTPMIENGEAKEVVHELTVEFKIMRPSR